jgi:hypothetical protein
LPDKAVWPVDQLEAEAHNQQHRRIAWISGGLHLDVDAVGPN